MIRTICSLTEDELFDTLLLILEDCGYEKEDIIVHQDFLYVKGAIPIALVAHLDTVAFAPPDSDAIFHDILRDVYWSPDLLGADDRAGVFAILSILQRGYRPSIIFTKGEEKGGVGAFSLVTQLPEMPDIKFLIELDRRGSDDAVYYDCDNKKFEKMINSYGFVTAQGSFSDISIIAPIWKVAAVNLSVGYFNEHSLGEFLVMRYLQDTIDRVCDILADNDKLSKYKYIAKKRIVPKPVLADYQVEKGFDF